MDTKKSRIVMYKRIIYRAQKYKGCAFGHFIPELLTGEEPTCVDIKFLTEDDFNQFSKSISNTNETSQIVPLYDHSKCTSLTINVSDQPVYVNCYYPIGHAHNYMTYGIDFDINALIVEAQNSVEDETIFNRPPESGLVFKVDPVLLSKFPERLSITKIMSNIHNRKLDCIGVMLFDTFPQHSCFSQELTHICYDRHSPIGQFFHDHLTQCKKIGFKNINNCDNADCWLH